MNLSPLEENKINFLEKLDEKEIKPQFPKKKKTGKIFLLTIIFLLVFLVSFFSPVIISTKKMLSSFNARDFFSIWKTVVKLISAQDKTMKGEKENRINILLLGIGGKGHDGPNLTDTIILLSIQPKEKKAAILSIPRDLYVPIPGYSWKKINSAYAYGEINNSGGELTSQVAEDILGMPINYYLTCDFNGFQKILDDLGGIEINVEKSFTDNEYPTSDFKIQTISFKEGLQKMSGEKALEFVRSRHGNNGEGSDFARSKRQEKVIVAVKNKIFSFGTLANPSKISNLLNSLSDHIKTNMELYEIIRLANLAKGIDYTKTITKVLDDSRDGPLYSDITVDGAFILKPKTGSFKEISDIAQNIFSEEPLAAAASNNEKAVQKTKIIVQNGTTYPGLAFNSSEDLKSLNFDIIEIGNAAKQDYEKTIIYDLTNGLKNDSLKILKEKFNAEDYPSSPEFLANGSGIDFLIILGKNVVPTSATNTKNYSL